MDVKSEDYGKIIGNPYVILADGCSTAPDTDFGSRLLAKSAEQFLNANNQNIVSGIISYAHTYARAMNLPVQSLSATLIMARAKDKNYKVNIVGDGVIAIKNSFGLVIRHIEFSSGAPYYLRYELSDTDKDRYFKEFGDKVLIHTYTMTPDVVKFVKTTDELKLNRDLPMFNWEWHDDDENETEFVAVFSDGAASFQRTIETTTSKSPETVPVTEAIMELTSFKRTNGEFILRWMNRCVKEFEKKKWQYTDDLSMGVISF